jgi:hypothetical protein
LVQDWLKPQLLPQLPQLAGSLVVLVQVPLQSTVGGGQGLVSQAPVTQAWPLGQTLPQAPQLFESVSVSVQFPLQKLKPGGQKPPSKPQFGPTQIPQKPPMQAPPGGQTLPQPPQLLGSVWVSVQVTLQTSGPQVVHSVSPGGQMPPSGFPLVQKPT